MKLFRLFAVILALPFFAATCPGPTPTPQPSPVTIANSSVYWIPPVQNTDNSPLTDLAGYKIYYGAAPNSYSFFIVNNAKISSLRLNQFLITPGTYYLSMTAFDSLGLESSFSPAITFTAQ